MDGTKQCSKCGAFKPFAEFSPHKMGLGGVRSTCKPCAVAEVIKYRGTPNGRATQRRANKSFTSTPEGRAAKALSARKAYVSNPVRFMLMRSRQRAIEKGIEHTITEADVPIPDVCPVLGIPLRVCSRGSREPIMGGRDNSPSIDRIDRSKGYVPGNVAVISWRANNVKGTATLEELEALVRWLRAAQTASGGMATGGSAT